MDDLDRRTIRPAHPKATIPDPDHRCDLPPDGCEVIWSHYWADHLAKGNIEIVTPVAAPRASETPATEPPTSEAAAPESPKAPADH